MLKGLMRNLQSRLMLTMRPLYEEQDLLTTEASSVSSEVAAAIRRRADWSRRGDHGPQVRT